MKINIIALSLILISFASCDKKSESVQTQSPTTVTEVVETPQKTEVEEMPATTEVVTNTAAPEYMNLDLQGFGVPNTNLNSFYGEVVFLNHWGSWCGPCRMEMPSIQKLYDKYGDKVKFVMIASERRPGAHVPYIEKEGFTFPVYVMNSPISTEIKAKGFPTTIVLDKTGKIRTNDVGAADWNSPNVHAFLDELLAEN